MWLRSSITLVCSGLLCAAALAQPTAAFSSTAAAKARRGRTARAAHRKPPHAALRRECVAAVGFCVDVPAGWQRLGNVFGELGFVTAEPHAGASDSTWPQLTVAVLPPARNGADAPSLDSLVDRMLTPDSSLPSPRTLQRRRLFIHGSAAEMVEVQLSGNASGAAGSSGGAIEEVALIAGDNGFVYSIALRCEPSDFARLDPVFQRAAQSWRLQPPTAAPKPEGSAQPKPAPHPPANPEKP